MINFKSPKTRTFALLNVPNMMDPVGYWPLIEYSAYLNKVSKEGDLICVKRWAGWKPKLISFLIRFLLPEPTSVYVSDPSRKERL